MIGVAESENWKKKMKQCFGFSSRGVYFFLSRNNIHPYLHQSNHTKAKGCSSREPGVVQPGPNFPQSPHAGFPPVKAAAFDSEALVPHKSCREKGIYWGHRPGEKGQCHQGKAIVVDYLLNIVQ